MNAKLNASLALDFLINASIGALGVDTTSLWKFLVVLGDAVEVLLKNGLLLNMLELGLEVLQASGVATAV